MFFSSPSWILNRLFSTYIFVAYLVFIRWISIQFWNIHSPMSVQIYEWLWWVGCRLHIVFNELWDFIFPTFAITHIFNASNRKMRKKNATDDDKTTRHDYLLWSNYVFLTLLNHLLVWTKMLMRLFVIFSHFLFFHWIILKCA